MRSLAHLVLALVLLVPGCGGRKEPLPRPATDAGAPAAGPSEAAVVVAPGAPVELRGADGQLALSLAPGADGWRLGPASGSAAAPRIHAVGEEWLLDSGGAPLARIRLGAAGPELVNAAGQVLCRIHAPDAATFDLIGTDGVALLRTRPDPEVAGGAIARDAAGRPFATAHRDPDAAEGTAPVPLVISSRDGAILATVHATRDARAALVLALPPLPPALRALLAVYALEHPGR